MAAQDIERAIAMKNEAIESMKAMIATKSNSNSNSIANNNNLTNPSITIVADQVRNWQQGLDIVQREIENAEKIIENVYSQPEKIREKTFQNEKWKTFVKGFFFFLSNLSSEKKKMTTTFTSFEC